MLNDSGAFARECVGAMNAAVVAAIAQTEKRVRAECAADLAANASMLARQTDLARQAENDNAALRQQLAEARGLLSKLARTDCAVCGASYPKCQDHIECDTGEFAAREWLAAHPAEGAS